MSKEPGLHKVLAVLLVTLLSGLAIQVPLTFAAAASHLGSDNRQVLNVADAASVSSAVLGAWQLTTPLLSAHADYALARSSDHVYVISGCGVDCMWGPSSAVEGAPIYASGDLGSWQALTSLGGQQGMAAVAAGNYLYALGGYGSSLVQRALINADGTLSQSEYFDFMTTSRFRFAAVVVGNYIYALGGWGGQSIYYPELLSSVERAMINGDGTLGTWEPAPSMVVGRMEFAAFVAGNHLYALGGEGQQGGNWSSLASIERAAIQPDGSLGAWEIIGAMPTARHAFAAVYSNGDLYVLGGNSSLFLNTVDKATVNSDGTISNWQPMPPMLAARNYFGAVATDSYLYAIGGWTDGSGSGQMQTVERAPIVEPGAISAVGDGWITSAKGAYPSSPSLDGKADIEFSAKLRKGATTPVGQTKFDFKAAKLSFKSTSYDSLLIIGDKAQVAGSGTINGQGSYGFLVSAIAGKANGKKGQDKIRIKIWNEANGAIVYDNQPGASDTDDPTMTLGQGRIDVRTENPLPAPVPTATPLPPPTPTPNPYPYPYP